MGAAVKTLAGLDVEQKAYLIGRGTQALRLLLGCVRA